MNVDRHFQCWCVDLFAQWDCLDIFIINNNHVHGLGRRGGGGGGGGGDCLPRQVTAARPLQNLNYALFKVMPYQDTPSPAALLFCDY